MNRTYHLPLLALALLSGAIFACNELLEDSSFQLWCGDTLCHWDVEEGSIRRIGTWHPNDYGVELVETPTVLSQVAGLPTSDWEDFAYDGASPDEIEERCGRAEGIYFADVNRCVLHLFDDAIYECVRFELTADVDASAQVQIEVDYGADGTVDATQALPTSHWEPISFLMSLPPWAGRVRYRIHKRGMGRARVAHFGVFFGADLECVDAIPDGDRPLGVSCDTSDVCASGVCADVGTWRACSECADDAMCDAGESCVEVFDDEHPNGAYRACRAAP